MYKKGDNLSRGQAMLVAVFVIVFMTLSIVAYGITSVIRDVKAAEVLGVSKRVAILAESGVEDVAYRVMNGYEYDSSEVLVVADGSTVTEVENDILTNEKIIKSISDISESIRKKETRIIQGDGVSVNYGVQVGEGGFLMQNSSSVTGNVYSNNTVTGSGNRVTGSIVSAGATGSIIQMESGEDMYAHTITNSIVGRDAYYTN